MNQDQRQTEAPVGARLDTALALRGRGAHLMANAGTSDVLPRAYPVEILGNAKGGFLAHFPDLPEAGETAGLDAADVLARLPAKLLNSLRQRVRNSQALPQPSPAKDRPLVAIAVEALPSLLLHQRMLAAGLDDAEVERRMQAQGHCSVAELRDPVAAADTSRPHMPCLELVMLALWVVDGGNSDEAFTATGVYEDLDVLTWSHRQAALLTLALAGVEAPGLQVANAVDELGSVGRNIMQEVHSGLRRGTELLMEAMAVDAAMGTTGAAPATLLLRRAAEAFRQAEAHLDLDNLPDIRLDEIWRDARWITTTRLEVLGLSIAPVPLECPLSIEAALEALTSTDVTTAALKRVLRVA